MNNAPGIIGSAGDDAAELPLIRLILAQQAANWNSGLSGLISRLSEGGDKKSPSTGVSLGVLGKLSSSGLQRLIFAIHGMKVMQKYSRTKRF